MGAYIQIHLQTYIPDEIDDDSELIELARQKFIKIIHEAGESEFDIMDEPYYPTEENKKDPE